MDVREEYLKNTLTFKPKLCERSMKMVALKSAREPVENVLLNTTKFSPVKSSTLLDLRKQVKFKRESSQVRSTGNLLKLSSDPQYKLSSRNNFTYAPILSHTSKSKNNLKQKRMSSAEARTTNVQTEEDEVYST